MELLPALYQELSWRQDSLTMFGRKVNIPRLQAWYGDNELSYTYSNLTLVAIPWTERLKQLKEQIEAICHSDFNAVLANCYRDNNDSVGWHSDDEDELGSEPVIASLSFGATRFFQFKHKITGEKFRLPLHSGDLLVMSGETQSFWQHAIHKTRRESPMRINLTFRKIIE